MKEEWLKALRDKQYVNLLIVSFICLFVAITILTKLLTFIEFRQSSVLNDPILNLFKPVDISLFIFILTYFTVLYGCIVVLKSPKFTLQTLIIYTIILIFRIITLYVTPLDAPAEIIPLRDYLLEPTVYSTRVNLKDLFFSGHTAMAFMFYMIARRKVDKYFFLLATVVIGLSLIIQHVHYTVDILTAPLFVWVAVYLSKAILNRQ